MAQATLPGGIWAGRHPVYSRIASSVLPRTIDAAGKRVAFVVSAPLAGTLQTAEFRLGGVGTPQDLRVSFQDLDATDLPDGTADQYAVVPSASVVTDAWIVPGPLTDT